MTVTVTLDLPPEVEQRLRAETPDLEAEVREAFVLDLFRRGKVSHSELATLLALDRFETDVLLKRHGVYDGSLTMDDLEADRRTLDRVLGGAG